MPEHQQTQQSKKTNTIFQNQATPVRQTPVSNPYSIIQRAKINPKSLTYADIMQLQRTIGNQAVGRLFSEIGLIPSNAKQAPPVQRQEIPEEEEPLQGKMAETVQRQEIPEEEEPLQGKFENIQRQEIPDKEKTCPSCMQRQEIPEEEEPLQGKMAETVQRQEISEEEYPLQGKMDEIVQRQEIPEEEEPLQGKMIETVQMQEIPEEPLHGKFETVQRQEIPEEEEPLQGKFTETIQRQEIPEEEEPLQGKFESRPEIACPSCFASPIVQRQKIPEEEEPLQGKMIGTVQRQEIPEEEEPLQTKRENNTGMPDNLKAGVENLSGIDMSDVRVHYNSSKPADVEALAYTQGTNIHVAPGQERHLPHEAWHVVQQKQKRVQATTQMKESVHINDDKMLEHEADAMGKRAAAVGSLTMPLQPFKEVPLSTQKIVQKQSGKDDDGEPVATQAPQPLPQQQAPPPQPQAPLVVAPATTAQQPTQQGVAPAQVPTVIAAASQQGLSMLAHPFIPRAPAPVAATTVPVPAPVPALPPQPQAVTPLPTSQSTLRINAAPFIPSTSQKPPAPAPTLPPQPQAVTPSPVAATTVPVPAPVPALQPQPQAVTPLPALAAAAQQPTQQGVAATTVRTTVKSLDEQAAKFWKPPLTIVGRDGVPKVPKVPKIPQLEWKEEGIPEGVRTPGEAAKIGIREEVENAGKREKRADLISAVIRVGSDVYKVPYKLIQEIKKEENENYNPKTGEAKAKSTKIISRDAEIYFIDIVESILQKYPHYKEEPQTEAQKTEFRFTMIGPSGTCDDCQSALQNKLSTWAREYKGLDFRVIVRYRGPKQELHPRSHNLPSRKYGFSDAQLRHYVKIQKGEIVQNEDRYAHYKKRIWP